MKIVLIVVVCLGVLLGCGTSSGASNDQLTYSQSVRQMGRPPSASRTLPDGGLEATLDTEIPGGKRRLVMTFDRSRKLESSRTETIPR